MVHRGVILGLGALGLAAAGYGVGQLLAGSQPPKERAGVQVAGPGGETVSDVDPDWQVTIPEGWRWQVNDRYGAREIKAIAPGTPDILLQRLQGSPDSNKEAVCEIFADTDKDHADLTQAELNKRTAGLAESWQEDPMSRPEPPEAKALAFVAVHEANGVTAAAQLYNQGIRKGRVGLTGQAAALRPGKWLKVSCTIAYTAGSAFTHEPEIAAVGDLLRSFQAQ